MAEVVASDKDAWETQGEGLSSLSDLRRFDSLPHWMLLWRVWPVSIRVSLSCSPFSPGVCVLNLLHGGKPPNACSAKCPPDEISVLGSFFCAVVVGPSISVVHRNVGYMSELEEATLPHKLEELAACPAEDIVRALRRDHR